MRALTMFVVLGLAAGLPSAQSEVQEDWSGGDGKPGPVTDWGDAFETGTDVSWLSVPGRLALSSVAVTSPPEAQIATTRIGFGIQAADLDGDGDLDVAGTSEGDREVLWWRNDGGDPLVLVEYVVESNLPEPIGLYTADFDIDGRLDLVVSAKSLNEGLVWFRNEGGDPITWTKHVIYGPWSSCFELSVSDVNHDGRPDVLGGSWNGQRVCWFENGGGSPIAWTRHVVDAAFPGAHCVKAADLDGDGDEDIVATGGVVDEVAWWSNDGGDPVVWTKHVIRTGFTGGRSVAVEDIDRDGDLDVAGTCWSSEVTWWRNDGGRPLAWTEQVIHGTVNGGHHVKVTDVNGDGRWDVLVAAFASRDVVWFENGGGDPIVWTRWLVHGMYPLPTEVDAADLDGDGALEILACGYSTSGRFSYFDATDFVAAGELTSSIVDTGGGLPTAKLDWSASEPPGTDLHFRVRSSDDPLDLGAWSAETETPALVGDLGRYVQYCALLASSDPEVSPVLDAVSISTPSVTYRNGSGTNPEIFTSTALPLLGANWTAEVDGGAIGAVGLTWVAAYDAPLDPGIPLGVGELLLDPTSAWLANSFSDLSGGPARHAISIPLDLALVGFRVFTQAYLADVGGHGCLANAIDLVLGR